MVNIINSSDTSDKHSGDSLATASKDFPSLLTVIALGASIITIAILINSIGSINANVNAATDITDQTTITVPSSCTMSGNITTGNEHTASINPNTYQDNIGKTTITTFCNDVGGYAIYAIGYTGNEYTGEDHTKLIGTNTNQKISTGTAKTGTSQWAMRITPVTGTYAPTIENNYDSENYHIVPDTYEKVATYGNSTDATGGTGSSIETTYTAYISGTQAADTYTGKVKYTLVHPATEVPLQPQATEPGYIAYYPNAKDTEGTMGRQSLSTSDTSATLIASNFSRTGYGFAGWSDKFDYATNPNAKFYGPNETINFTAGQYSGTNNGLSLYAVWIKSEGSLQDSTKTASVCNSLTKAPIDGTANLSSVSALTDSRDNNTYAIAKLADGKCWMIENLRLADKDSNGNYIELSSTNTNNPSLPLTNIYDATNPTTSNHLSASTNPTSTAWCTSNSPDCYNQSMSYTGNTTERGTNPATGANTYSYGNYYNWYSATAGHGKYSVTSGDTAGDICPSGWKLPLGNTSTGNIEQGESDVANRVGGFSYLDRKMGGTGQYQGTAVDSLRWRKYPVNFLYSGVISIGSVGLRGSSGYYWSSTAYDSLYAYGLSLGSSDVAPGIDYNVKYGGKTIRCLMGS